MRLKARNAIVPQMADYDLVGDQWVPYLMRFDRPLRNFPSVSTNEWGFRTTLDRAGGTLSADEFRSGTSAPYHGVVVGSSAVFGVGATHDSHTIPSVLNRTTDGLWLNFGGRAFNSTQELLLLQLHLPKKLDRIVVFSGVNNLTLAFLSDRPSSVYNSFFYQTLFEEAMVRAAKRSSGLADSTLNLLRKIGGRLSLMLGNTPARTVLSDYYEQVLACFRRDLRVMAALASGIGAELYFVLQPLATWIEKDLAPEERQLFGILDGLSMDWHILARSIAAVRDRYFDDMAAACASLDIPFYNLNLDPAFAGGEWLFADRVHLTDRGYDLASEILKREFSL